MILKAKIMLPVLLIAGMLSSSYNFPEPERVNTDFDLIVIDAGHGGKDPGAHGDDAQEKNVTLAIALQLKEIINEKLPHVKVILTRDDDTFVELHNRAEKAYSNKADFFVSIHCNANPNSAAYGTETYVMGLHKEDANLNMIMRENKAILMEDNHQDHYSNFDPESVESYIMFNLIKNAYLQESIKMAQKVQKSFEKTGRKNRGVKQAGFLVLWKASTPSILIETGFLTNDKEEKFLNSEEGRTFLAQSIYSGIKSYAASLN